MQIKKIETIDMKLVKIANNFFLFSVLLAAIVMLVAYIVNPDLEGITNSLESKLPKQIVESNGVEKLWSYIVNNGFKVPLQMLILSLIPIQFLYLANVILTTSIAGFLFGAMLRESLAKGIGLIVSAAPHFIFEIFALCLFAAVLFELNCIVRIKVKNIFRGNRENVSFNKKIIETTKVYVVFFLPLIIVAAVLETYVADIILKLF